MIVLDVREKIPFEINEGNSNTTAQGTKDFIRYNALRPRPILLSDVKLLTLRQGVSRRDLMKFESVPPVERIRGLDVYRLLLQDIEMLRDCENEIFPCVIWYT